MATRFVPFSVHMRRAGFVPTHSTSWSIHEPKWVQAPTVDMRKVDRVINTLSRFIAKWVAQSRDLRRNRRREPAKYQPGLWYDLELIEERNSIRRTLSEHLEHRLSFDRYAHMPEREWNAVVRGWIHTYRRADRDLLPLLRGDVARVNSHRADIAAVEQAFAARIHNRQRSAPVRVARVVRRSGFAALNDSDSE